jgi:Uma2 family endonuclease
MSNLKIQNQEDLYQMQSLETKPLLLDVGSITLRVTHEEFEKLCHDNPDRSLELTAAGELIVMAPAGWESSERNLSLGTDVEIWNRQTKLGRAFDSSGGFTLPNGAIRSPDVTWIDLSSSIFRLVLSFRKSFLILRSS